MSELVTPDIADDETLVRVLDELAVRIHGGKYNEQGISLTEEFSMLLNNFITDHGLDWDQPHTQARMPGQRLDREQALRKRWSVYQEELANDNRTVLGTCNICGKPVYHTPGGALCDKCGGGVPYTPTEEP